MPIEPVVTSGRLAVFARQADGLLGRAWQARPNGDWLAWEELGIAIDGPPVAAQNADGRLEVFAVDGVGRLGHMWQERGAGGWWSEWVALGPTLRGAPVVVQNAHGRLELFALGPDGRLGHMWQQPPEAGGWSGWEALGPVIRGAPRPGTNADGRLELFAIGPDGRLGHVWQWPRDTGGWSEWKDLGPALASDPAVVQIPDGRLELFAVGPDGRLGHMWQLERNGVNGWSDWNQLGPEITSRPAVFQNADGRLEVFGAGPDGRLGHRWHAKPNGAGGWSAWKELGPGIASDPTVFRNADGRLELFAVGPDGRLGHRGQLAANGTGGWSGWRGLGPKITGREVAVCACTNHGLVGRSLLTMVEQRAASGAPLLVPSAITADVCVIGAGPAGITVSDGLVRAGASVVLVESGGWEEEAAADELNRGVVDGPLMMGYSRYLTEGRRRQVQGSGNAWDPGWCGPVGTIDLEPRPWVEHSGWTLSPAELAPYETQAAATLGVDAFATPRAEAALVDLSYRRLPDPEVFRAMFLQLLTNRRFRSELRATAVALQATRGRIDSVRCRRLGDGELRIIADTTVLAAGGIENARLLLLNGHVLPRPAAMTGRCFMVHPHVLAGTVRVPDGEVLRPYLERTSTLGVLALSEAVQRDRELLNASVQLRQSGEGSLDKPTDCELHIRARAGAESGEPHRARSRRRPVRLSAARPSLAAHGAGLGEHRSHGEGGRLLPAGAARRSRHSVDRRSRPVGRHPRQPLGLGSAGDHEDGRGPDARRCQPRLPRPRHNQSLRRRRVGVSHGRLRPPHVHDRRAGAPTGRSPLGLALIQIERSIYGSDWAQQRADRLGHTVPAPTPRQSGALGLRAGLNPLVRQCGDERVNEPRAEGLESRVAADQRPHLHGLGERTPPPGHHATARGLRLHRSDARRLDESPRFRGARGMRPNQ